MNTGIIASRYASALLKLVDENGSGETVFTQVRALQAALDLKELRAAVEDRIVPADRKIALLRTAVGGSLAPELDRFIRLLCTNGRIGDIRLVFNTFLTEYSRSRRVVRGRLAVADASVLPSLEARLRTLVEKYSGFTLELTTEVDPGLIGGFVIEFADNILDASVLRQVTLIRRQFEERNKRIV